MLELKMMQYIIEQIEDKYDTYLSEDEIALIYEVIDVIYETRFRSAREFANMIKSGEIPTRTLPNGKREIIRDKYHISLDELNKIRKPGKERVNYKNNIYINTGRSREEILDDLETDFFWGDLSPDEFAKARKEIIKQLDQDFKALPKEHQRDFKAKDIMAKGKKRREEYLENKRQKKQAENLFKYHFIDKFLLNAPNREATTIANNWIGKNALWNKISSVGDAIGAKAASMGDAIGAKAASMGDAIGAKIGSMSPYIDQISNLPGIFS